MPNPLLDWVNSDSKLRNLLESIDSDFNTEYDKAKTAFNKLSELYELPKYPDEIDDTPHYNSVSVYEVLGKLKFANDRIEDLKSNVLLAAYLIRNKFEPDIDNELASYLGSDILSGFGYKGEGIDVELIPIKVGESWFEKGCTYFTKEV